MNISDLKTVIDSLFTQLEAKVTSLRIPFLSDGLVQACQQIDANIDGDVDAIALALGDISLPQLGIDTLFAAFERVWPQYAVALSILQKFVDAGMVQKLGISMRAL